MDLLKNKLKLKASRSHITNKEETHNLIKFFFLQYQNALLIFYHEIKWRISMKAQLN